jgi:hypothetical protein
MHDSRLAAIDQPGFQQDLQVVRDRSRGKFVFLNDLATIDVRRAAISS